MFKFVYRIQFYSSYNINNIFIQQQLTIELGCVPSSTLWFQNTKLPEM